MNTLEEIKRLVNKNFDVDISTLKPDAPLAEYGLDSLSLIELMFAVEDDFGIKFPETRQDVGTLKDLAGLIDELRSKQKS